MMKRRHHILFIVLFFCILPFNLMAAAVIEEPAEKRFNIEEANTRFDKISLKLSTENLNPDTLNDSIAQLNELIDGANDCIEDANKDITQIDTQLQQYFGEPAKAPEGVDANYLKNQKQTLSKRLAECRLFKIRATEAMEAYRKTALSLQQKITLTRGETVIQRLQKLPTDLQSFNLPTIEPSQKEDVTNYWIYGLPLLLLSAFINWQSRRLTHKKWRKKPYYFILNTILLFLIFFLAAISLISPEPFALAENNALFARIISETLWFFLLVYIYHFLFLLRRLPTVLRWYGFNVIFLKRLGLTVIILYFARWIGLDLLSLHQATDNLIQLYESCLLLISLIAMLYFSVVFYKGHPQLLKRLKHPEVWYQFIILIALSLLTLDFVGYTVLTLNIANLIFTVFLIAALGALLLRGIDRFYKLMSYSPSSHQMLKTWFGYTGQPPYLELLILKIIAQIIVLIGLLYLFAELVNELSYFIYDVLDHIVNGFQFFGVNINPLQWLIGIFVFCLLILLSRYISTQISHREQFDKEEETQVALASIMLYVGFSLSIIIGLLMAGFSFTSLAIIAGALSVGIGLGLQSIVNNFFSGLILLIEKPIKAGDRIKVDGIEGFVKKVRVRSTQLLTPAQEDIIIPNSDLITHQVTNYMFSDKSWRVKCQVGVAYGSDTDLVNEVLFEVANGHPEVKKSQRKKPLVLFRSFGDSALIFELWCMIRDVNKKYVVESELNFAIDKAFRKHNISIAFPQQDVHLKFDDKNLPWTKKNTKK